MIFGVENSIKRVWQAAGTQTLEEVCAGAVFTAPVFYLPVFMLPGEGKVGGGQHKA